MKRILNFIAKDLTISLRDQVMIYMLVMPVVLSLIFSFFIGSLENTQMTFVVGPDVDAKLVQGLEKYGQVDVETSVAAVNSRVMQIDDVVGITQSGGQYTVVLEGNEMESLKEIAGMVVDQAASGHFFGDYEVQSLGRVESQFKDFIIAAMILTGALMGALMSAFNIIDEKESRALQALGISPLSFGEMIAARTIMGIVIGIVLGVTSAVVMAGFQINFGLLILGIIFSTALTLLIGFGIGGFSDSQITAIGLIKVVFLFFTAVPIAAMFMPEKWLWTLYAFPNFWAFRAIMAVFANPLNYAQFWWSSLWLVAISVVLILVMTPGLKKRLFLR